MPRNQHISPLHPKAWYRALFKRHLPLETETVWFIVASVGDILLTWTLLYHHNFRESNPVALWFLNRWGVKGLIYFKFAMVGFVCLIVQWIARRRPATARNVLYFATFIVSLVVLYSLTLLLRARGIIV